MNSTQFSYLYLVNSIRIIEKKHSTYEIFPSDFNWTIMFTRRNLFMWMADMSLNIFWFGIKVFL